MINDVMVFTPVYRLEPETVQAVFDLRWDGPITWVFQEDNPLEGTDRTTGVRNHLHQYQRGRELFLQSRCDAMLIIESDIIPPPDTLEKLAALDADLAYGVYVFRAGWDKGHPPVVNLFEFYHEGALNIGESFSHRGLWPPPRDIMRCAGAGFGCLLIKRHVLEKMNFRVLNVSNNKVHCDSYFTTDVYQAGYTMMADTRVICGHVTPEGEVLWPSSK